MVRSIQVRIPRQTAWYVRQLLVTSEMPSWLGSGRTGLRTVDNEQDQGEHAQAGNDGMHNGRQLFPSTDSRLEPNAINPCRLSSALCKRRHGLLPCCLVHAWSYAMSCSVKTNLHGDRIYTPRERHCPSGDGFRSGCMCNQLENQASKRKPAQSSGAAAQRWAKSLSIGIQRCRRQQPISSKRCTRDNLDRRQL